MKKILLAAVSIGMVLSFAAGHADPTNGCVAGDSNGVPGSNGGAISCSYTATGPGQYVAATPNHYTISVTHAGVTTNVVESDSASLPTNGTFDAASGDTVTISVGPDSPGGPVNGSIGIVAADDAA